MEKENKTDKCFMPIDMGHLLDMELRDLFAIIVLKTIMEMNMHDLTLDKEIDISYKIADKMIERRKEKD